MTPVRPGWLASLAVSVVATLAALGLMSWARSAYQIRTLQERIMEWSLLFVPTDLFERRIVASVAGLVGFGGAMGGLLMNQIAGRLLDLGFGYQTVFSIVGLLHITAFVVILIAIPRIIPIVRKQTAS